MKLTDKEEKIARLALDKGAKDGERDAAAKKLIESLYKRGVRVEDLQNEVKIHTEQPKPEPKPYVEPEFGFTPKEPYTPKEVHVGTLLRKILLGKGPTSEFDEVVWIFLAWLVILGSIVAFIAGTIAFFQAFPAVGLVGLIVLCGIGFNCYLQRRAR
jgi:hypothetical protein